MPTDKYEPSLSEAFQKFHKSVRGFRRSLWITLGLVAILIMAVVGIASAKSLLTFLAIVVLAISIGLLCWACYRWC